MRRSFTILNVTPCADQLTATVEGVIMDHPASAVAGRLADMQFRVVLLGGGSSLVAKRGDVSFVLEPGGLFTLSRVVDRSTAEGLLAEMFSGGG